MRDDKCKLQFRKRLRIQSRVLPCQSVPAVSIFHLASFTKLMFVLIVKTHVVCDLQLRNLPTGWMDTAPTEYPSETNVPTAH